MATCSFLLMSSIIVFILYINIDIVLILYMIQINFECRTCGLIDPTFTKQDILDHLRSHKIDDIAVENTQGLIRKELLLD